MPDKNSSIVAQLAELVATLERKGTDTAAVLRELIDNGAYRVEGCRHAGITVADSGAGISNIAATHHYATDLDAVQDRYREGPCVAAAWEHHVMHIADLAADARWPHYQQYALEHTPIRSILSYELFVDGGTTAALNFYAE